MDTSAATRVTAMGYSSMQATLADKHVLIIGGSAGLGLAVARRAHAAGARLAVVSRHATERREDLHQAIGPDITTHSLDIARGDDLAPGLRGLGAIDHLVITVRPPVPAGSFAELDWAAARAAFEAKLWGPCRVIQAVLPQLAPEASITLTSGIAGEKIYAGTTVMALVNAATETLCRALAVELAPRRVNVVSPGFVEPKPEAVQAYAQQFPAGRLGQADEVAESYLYAMTHPYVTGATLWVDGGARLIQ